VQLLVVSDNHTSLDAFAIGIRLPITPRSAAVLILLNVITAGREADSLQGYHACAASQSAARHEHIWIQQT
jgi:Ni,Fe-hydrogenase III small subunit